MSELPPLSKHDHPESQIMVWSELEMAAIRQYATLAVAAERARAESAEAERDRYRDALIACRPAVQYARLHAQTDMSRAVLTEHLDTIAAAASAKGQG